MQRMHIDALAFTGHKGLLGPQGIGGLVLASGMEREMEPLIAGGTGSVSHTEEMPAFTPSVRARRCEAAIASAVLTEILAEECSGKVFHFG